MKKIVLTIVLLLCLKGFTQEHFSGISTSSRVGIINGMLNPAELARLESKFEVQFFATSINVANNKIGFKDLTGNSDFEALIFSGEAPVNFRLDAEILGPGVAFKYNQWGFAITTKAYAKLNIIDVDVNIGDAISNAGLNSLIGSTSIQSNYNQRLNGTTWGEIGFGAARSIFSNEKHNLHGGATLKFLFPGSYANFGASQFSGNIDNTLGNAYLNNTTAAVNIAYSGNLGDSFTEFSDYSRSLFGGLNGIAFDFGLQYQLKNSNQKVLLNSGLAFRNMGGMRFKSNNNSNTNYSLNIPEPTILNPGLDLSLFSDVTSLQEVETILLESGYLTGTTNNRDFRVALPATMNLYADFQLIPKIHLTAFLQQKLNNDSDNDQITTQNILSLTPRINFKNFEIFSSWARNEISGVTGGVGFRAGGFFLGSGSILTALINDSKQADIFLGWRIGIGNHSN